MNADIGRPAIQHTSHRQPRPEIGACGQGL